MSSQLETLLEVFPPESRELVRSIWGGVPPDVRRELELTLGLFSKLVGKSPASSNELLTVMQRMAGPAVAPLSKVAVVGPVNVGKSTLYNSLVTLEESKAEVSPVAGTTRQNQVADLGLFSLVDTPGADHGSEEGAHERNLALEAAEEADFLVIVFDAARSVTASDRALYLELAALKKPHLVVLNKIDLVGPKDRDRVREAAARVLGLTPESVIPASAHKGRGTERLVLEIAAAEPRLLGQLGELMTPLRRKLGWQCVRRSVVAATVVALTPIPLMDIVPLTGVQVSMVVTLARIYGRPLNASRAFELVTTFGAGWLARLAFQELSKVAGAPGWLVSASVAGSATLAIGYACMRWFETGKKPSRKDLRSYTKEAQSKIFDALKKMGKKTPDKKSLTQKLEDVVPSVTQELERSQAEAGTEQ
ncbi:MAG: GTPase [Vulcanimicrobiota bacterium]